VLPGVDGERDVVERRACREAIEVAHDGDVAQLDQRRAGAQRSRRRQVTPE
jgi:hypothetical protein